MTLTTETYQFMEQLADSLKSNCDIQHEKNLVQQAKNILGATQLLTKDSSKIDKSNKFSDSYKTFVLYLPPEQSSGKINLCRFATSCVFSCLGIGSGRMNQGKNRVDNDNFDWQLTNVSRAMFKRLTLFLDNRPAFYAKLEQEIKTKLNTARKKGYRLAIRLNGTSDIRWEQTRKDIFYKFQDVIFFDYTKYPYELRKDTPDNYYLIYSYTANNNQSLDFAKEWLANGKNIAVVFDKLPSKFLGLPVIDADKHDMRFIDNEVNNINGSLIAGLKAKGLAINNDHGFIERVK